MISIPIMAFCSGYPKNDSCTFFIYSIAFSALPIDPCTCTSHLVLFKIFNYNCLFIRKWSQERCMHMHLIISLYLCQLPQFTAAILLSCGFFTCMYNLYIAYIHNYTCRQFTFTLILCIYVCMYMYTFMCVL